MHQKPAFLFLVTCFLSGCALFKASPPLPEQPIAPTGGDVVSQFDKAQSKSDDKVAASIAEARAQNKAGQPSKVENELAVAASFLPEPRPENLAEAHGRAERMDPKEYQQAVAYGMGLQKKIDDAWAAMENATKEAQRVSGLKDQKIAELEKQIDEVKKNAARNLYTMAAVGLLTLGGLAVAFSRYVAGAGLMVAGALVGAVPFLLDTVWFVPGVGLIAFVALFVTIWHLFKTPHEQKSP